MVRRDTELQLLDRIAERGRATPGERQQLRKLGAELRRDVRQGHLGRYTIDVDEADNLHIGDRVYYGVDADAIIRALSERPAPRLRGLSGVLITLGMVVAFVGFGIFIYALLMTISLDPEDGFPPEIGIGFGVVFVGICIAALGRLVAAWRGEHAPGAEDWWNRW
jgi:hypothetical protein